MLGQTTKVTRIATLTAVTASANYPLQLTEPVLNGIVLDVNLTAVTGTTPTLDLYFQTSKDGGSTWLDMAHLTQLITTTANHVFVSVPTISPSVLCGQVGDATASAGTVTGLPMLSPNVRVKAIIAGTSPVFTGTIDILIPEQPSIA